MICYIEVSFIDNDLLYRHVFFKTGLTVDSFPFNLFVIHAEIAQIEFFFLNLLDCLSSNVTDSSERLTYATATVIKIEMSNFSFFVVLSVLIALCSVTADLVDTGPSEGKGYIYNPPKGQVYFYNPPKGTIHQKVRSIFTIHQKGKGYFYNPSKGTLVIFLKSKR